MTLPPDSRSAAAGSISLNAGRLVQVRLGLLAVFMVLAAAAASLGFSLPAMELTVVIGVAALLSVLSGWYQRRRASGLQHADMAAQLAIDLVTLTAIVYLTGGWTNPMVSLYLVPVAVAAVTLPALHTWAFAGAAVAAYTLMTQLYRPVLHLQEADAGFSLHVTGMWMTFVVAAGLIAYFGTSMAATLRRHDRALAEARERNLRNEQIIAVATLAAGTAHELSTPLSTIAVIASELEATTQGQVRDDVRTVLREVEACREALNRLRRSAAPVTETIAVSDFLDEIRHRLLLLRPSVQLEVHLEERGAVLPELKADDTLRQALLNLLDNAADVSPDQVVLSARWQPGGVEIEILDRGPGLAGQPQVKGMGMGLLLANATIERLGGTVYASAREGGGTRLRVVLPVTEAGGTP